MTVNFFYIFCVSLLAYSAGDPVCGPESCNDLATVKTCKNVDYCIRDVWMKKKYPGSKDNVCDICLEMVKEARDQLQSNMTMTELKQVLEGSCELLYIKPAVVACKKLADNFVPELVKMLLSQMDPETVCSVAKLCNNAKLRQAQMDSAECVSCRKFVRSAEDMFAKGSQTQLVNQLMDVCRSMGTFSDACSLYLLYNPTVNVDVVRKALARRPCEAARICPVGTEEAVKNSDRHVTRRTWQASKSDMCSTCPSAAQALNAIIKTRNSPEKFVNWTVATCTSLTFPEEDCRTFAYDNRKRIHSYLTNSPSYNYMCTHGTGLCTKESESKSVWSLLPLRIDIELGRRYVQADQTKNLKPAGNDKVAKDFGISFGDPVPFNVLPVDRFLGAHAGDCQSCTNMFNAITQYMTTHQDFVDSVLNDTCSDLKLGSKCSRFLRDHGHLFKDSTHTVPEKVCPALVPFCSGTPIRGLTSTSSGSAEGCQFCVNVFDSLKTGTSTKPAEIQISTELKRTCRTVPSDMQAICHAFAENFLKNIIASVNAEMTSKEACNVLDLCKAAAPEPPKGVEGKNCPACLMIVQTIYDELKDKTGEEEIRKVLHSVCEKLPAGRDYCEVIVDQYSDELVQFVTDNLSPAEVCKKLHLCQPKSKLHRVGMSSEKGLNVRVFPAKKISCNFCLTAVKMVINQLTNNKTQEEIEEAMGHLCNYMPEEVKDTCKTLVEQYTEDIVDMLLADFNATEICMYLKLCGPKSLELGDMIEGGSGGFSVATNEVWRKYNPSGACHFCKLLEKSMAVRGYEEKGAESMLGLIADVCLTDSGNRYADCARKFTDEVLPVGKKALMAMSNICENMRICPVDEVKELRSEGKVLGMIESAVQECAMCEAVVGIVTSHMKRHAGIYDFAGNATSWCSSVPSDKQKMCESMLTSYAPSTVNLINEMHVKPDDVCFHLKLCDRNAQTKVGLPVTSIEQSGLTGLPSGNGNECLKGPSYWCASLENAKKCGTVPHCKEVVWKGEHP